MPRKRNPEAPANSPREKEKRLTLITFKTKPSLKARLEAEAEKSHRSLSWEIEYRLEQSLLGHRAYAHLFGDGYTMDRLMLLSGPLRLAQMETGLPWWGDKRTFELGKANLVKMMDMWLMPTRETSDRSAWAKAVIDEGEATGTGIKYGKGTLYPVPPEKTFQPFKEDATPSLPAAAPKRTRKEKRK